MDKILKQLPILIGIALLILSFYYFSNIWLYLIVSAVISLLGRSPVKYLSKIKIKNWHLPKGLAAGLTLVSFWVLLYFFLTTFVPLIANEAQTLSKVDVGAIQSYFQEPIDALEKNIKALNLEDHRADAESYFREKVSSVLNLQQVRDFFSNIVGAIGDLFIAVFSISFISFFFLKDDKLLMNLALAFAPKGKEDHVRHALLKIIKLLSRYFVGLILEVSAIITLVTLGLWGIGVDFSHAIVIGLIAGFLNVIPYIGPLTGMLFGTIIALASKLTEGVPDNVMWLSIGILAVFLAAQLIDNFVLQPLIYSNSVSANPLEIFIVILMAGTVWGIGGLILAIPCYTILRVIAKEVTGEFKPINELTKNI